MSLLFQPPFGKWLKQRRKQLDLTIEQLAQRASYSMDAIRKFEANALKPSRQAAAALASALEIPAIQHSAFIDFARGLELHHINNLPNPATSLVGREYDVTVVMDLLRNPDVRLVTLVGPPGVGKTRLATETAHRALSLFAHGACFVQLAHITQPDLVPGVVGDRLGLQHDHAAGVRSFLRDRQLLLVLDNFEQVLDASAYIAEWLSAAPDLKVLVTSRAVLHLSAEHAYPVEPLSLPDMEHLQDLEELRQVPAVALFLQRAQAAKSTVNLTLVNASDITTICNYLDGLPLALELAAGRVRMFTLHTLADRLNHVVGARMRFLTSGSRDLPKHQQTLRDAITWSHALLGDSEQRLLRRLGIFVNGFTLDAAQAVCAASDQSPEDITTALQTLVDHSLVQMREGLFDQPRYMLLESLRDFALEQLTLHEEMELMRRQHARYFGKKCDMDNNAPSWPYETTNALRWVASERANLTAAKQASRAYDDEPELHLDITSALAWLATTGFYYLGVTNPDQLSNEMQWSLARNPQLSLAKRAVKLSSLGIMAFQRDSLDEALAIYKEAIALSHAAGAFQFEAIMLGIASESVYIAGDLDAAESYLDQALAIYQQHEHEPGIMMTFRDQGLLAINRRNYARANKLLNQSLTLSRELGITTHISGGETGILPNISLLLYEQGDYAGCIAPLKRVLCLSTVGGEVNRIADAHLFLGRAYLALGDLDAAQENLLVHARMVKDHGWAPGITLAYLARLAQLQDDLITFTRLAGYVSTHPIKLVKVWTCFRPDIDQLIEQARAGLSNPELAAVWETGQALSDAEALDEVL